jgi:hypothetical protein
MMVNAFRFLSLVLTALVMGLAFCHVVQMPPKMVLGGPEYLLTLRMYGGFGPVGALLEPGAIVAAIVLATLVRRRRREFALATAGAACLVAGLLLWFVVVSPVNAHWAVASPSAPPADWVALRHRWEWGHAGHAVVLLMAFAALVCSVLTATSEATAGAWRDRVPPVADRRVA